MNKIDGSFLEVIRKLESNINSKANQDPSTCNGNGCYYGDICDRNKCYLFIPTKEMPLEMREWVEKEEKVAGQYLQEMIDSDEWNKL
jgi:hypothetical protein